MFDVHFCFCELHPENTVLKERCCPKIYAHWSYQYYLCACIGILKHPHLSWFRPLMSNEGTWKMRVKINLINKNGRNPILKINIRHTPQIVLYIDFKDFIFCVCIHVWMHIFVSCIYVLWHSWGDQRTTCENRFSFLSFDSRRLNSGCKVWCQVSLPMEPSCCHFIAILKKKKSITCDP